VPGFVAPGSGVGGFLLLGAIHITIAFCCHSTWATLLSTFRAHTSPRRLAALDAVTGVVLIVIGIRQGIA
jgi:threonine/homoserine/homoserine lactone efflux protein